MPFPKHAPRRPLRKRGLNAQVRISLTHRVSVQDSLYDDPESRLGDADFHDRWHLLSPYFDELPDDLRDLL